MADPGSAARAQDPPGIYVWPLAGYTDLSSGFCDYRARHYHGGIDLSTNGRQGIPVRAADSGWVERVSTSYWGYGKAVYLKLTDGRMAVYGHLSELSPAIQEYVEDNQYATKRYQQNLWPAARQIPVARAEIIGKTGQTGAGPPHLHFEIRTGDNRPLNPLTVGFEKLDKFAPSIHSVTIVPRQPDKAGVPASTVNGGPTSRSFDAVGQGAARTLNGNPIISGVCGIAVKTDDHIDAPRWTASTYRVRLWVNDVLITDLSHDSINYDDTRQILIERVYDARSGYSERPLTLFRQTGNTLWHYNTLLNDGWLATGETVIDGVNDIRIEATDAAGNSSSIRFKLTMTVDPPSAATDGSAAATPPRIIRAEPLGNGAILTLEHSTSQPPAALDPEFRTPLALLNNDAGQRLVWLPAESRADTIWLAANPQPVPHALDMRPVTIHDGGEVTSEDGLALARFNPKDLYQSAYFRLNQSGNPARAVSRLYELSPEAVPLARAATFVIRYDGTQDPARIALYRSRGQGRWDFVGNDLQPGPMIGGKIDWPGAFALLADHDPPVIRNVTPGRGESTRNKRPTIRFEMFDGLAGIGSDADVSLTIDGEWVPVEYDPDTRQAVARPRTALPKGSHEVKISVRDRVGNEASFLRIIRIIG